MKYWRVDASENTAVQQIPVINSLVQMDWNPKGPGSIADNNPAGRMLAIELPTGRYEFYAWHGTSVGYSFWSVTPFSYQFESVAGRAVDVGNMHLRFDGRRSRIGLLDSRERDIALMRQKVPRVPEDRMDT